MFLISSPDLNKFSHIEIFRRDSFSRKKELIIGFGILITSIQDYYAYHFNARREHFCGTLRHGS